MEMIPSSFIRCLTFEVKGKAARAYMKKEVLQNEFQFKFVRSSGPGGQHVNKVASKVLLFFDVAQSQGLTDEEKERLYRKWGARLSGKQVLILECEETRSQFRNKEKVVFRFFMLLKKALVVPRKRLHTKPSKKILEKNKKAKMRRAEVKKNRQKLRC